MRQQPLGPLERRLAAHFGTTLVIFKAIILHFGGLPDICKKGRRLLVGLCDFLSLSSLFSFRSPSLWQLSKSTVGRGAPCLLARGDGGGGAESLSSYFRPLSLGSSPNEVLREMTEAEKNASMCIRALRPDALSSLCFAQENTSIQCLHILVTL